MNDHWRLSASQLTQGFAGGMFSPVEVLEACLERSARCEPQLGAMLHIDAERPAS